MGAVKANAKPPVGQDVVVAGQLLVVDGKDTGEPGGEVRWALATGKLPQATKKTLVAPLGDQEFATALDEDRDLVNERQIYSCPPGWHDRQEGDPVLSLGDTVRCDGTGATVGIARGAHQSA